MEKFENKNYESERFDSIEKKSRKELKDLETEVTGESVDLSTPETAVESILDEMKGNSVQCVRKITLDNVSSRNNKVTYHTLGTGYEFNVSYQVDDGLGNGFNIKDNKVNYTIKYDGRTNTFYDSGEEIDEDQALEELVKIYSFVCAINDRKVKPGHNGGGSNSGRRR